MSRTRVPGDGPKCGCGAPAVWSGFCQMEDGRGYCNARPAPQILFPSDVPPDGGGSFYGVSVGPQMEQRERFARLLRSLDELVAVWSYATGKAPSQATIFELMQWTNEQRLNPTELER